MNRLVVLSPEGSLPRYCKAKQHLASNGPFAEGNEEDGSLDCHEKEASSSTALKCEPCYYAITGGEALFMSDI